MLAKIYRDMLICPENLIKSKTSRPAAARSSLTVLKDCRDSVPRTRNATPALFVRSGVGSLVLRFARAGQVPRHPRGI